jgi:hypothetical protein
VDNGREFINNKLIAYCLGHGIELSRSRPYRKGLVLQKVAASDSSGVVWKLRRYGATMIRGNIKGRTIES